MVSVRGFTQITLMATIVATTACGGGGGDAPLPLPLASGSLDHSFGVDGIVITDLVYRAESLVSIAVQSDDKIVIGVPDDNNSATDDFVLARFNPDGTSDTGFDGDGVVTTDFSNRVDYIADLLVQPDGQILAVGASFDLTTGQDFALARYNGTDGSADTSFRTVGRGRTDMSNGDEFARAVALQSSGKIIAAGTTDSNGTFDFALVRYDTDGARDTTFNPAGINGIEKTDFNSNDDYVRTMVVDNMDRIIVAGRADGHMALARYNIDGGLDTTFGIAANGKVMITEGNGSEIYASVIQDDGKIILVGMANYGNGRDVVVMRLHEDGTFDTTGFGTSGTGLVIFDLTTGGDDIGFDVIVQQDGKIVLTGVNDLSQIFVMRLNQDGSLDNTFGTGGMVQPAIPDSFATGGTALSIQSDGKIVVAGARMDMNLVQHAFLLRLNP